MSWDWETELVVNKTFDAHLQERWGGDSPQAASKWFSWTSDLLSDTTVGDMIVKAPYPLIRTPTFVFSVSCPSPCFCGWLGMAEWLTSRMNTDVCWWIYPKFQTPWLVRIKATPTFPSWKHTKFGKKDSSAGPLQGTQSYGHPTFRSPSSLAANNKGVRALNCILIPASYCNHPARNKIILRPGCGSLWLTGETTVPRKLGSLQESRAGRSLMPGGEELVSRERRHAVLAIYQTTLQEGLAPRQWEISEE